MNIDYLIIKIQVMDMDIKYLNFSNIILNLIMNWILKLVLFATLMALALGHLKGKSASKFQNKTMTVDENHFVSNTTKEKTFTI